MIAMGAGPGSAEEATLKSTIPMPYETAGKVVRIVYHSPLLQRNRPALIYLPPGYDAAHAGTRYPTLYFLHGYPGSIQDWIERGSAQSTLDRKIRNGEIQPVIAVFVAGDGPGGHRDCDAYLNRADGRFPLEDSVVRELVPLVDRRYPTRATASARAVIGLSEGAFAAANLAVRHPDTFRIAACHSGYFDAAADPQLFRSLLGPTGALCEQNSPERQIQGMRDPRELHFFLGAGARD
jgi:enterochelin esterase-like enzyme